MPNSFGFDSLPDAAKSGGTATSDDFGFGGLPGKASFKGVQSGTDGAANKREDFSDTHSGVGTTSSLPEQPGIIESNKLALEKAGRGILQYGFDKVGEYFGGMVQDGSPNAPMLANIPTQNLTQIQNIGEQQQQNQATLESNYQANIEQQNMLGKAGRTAEYYGREAANNAAPVVVGVGTSVFAPEAAPVVLPTLFGGMAAGDTYAESRAAGNTPEIAEQRAAASGAINASLALLPAEAIASKIVSPYIKSAVVVGTNEAAGTLAAPISMAADDAITGKTRSVDEYLAAAGAAAKSNILPSVAFGLGPIARESFGLAHSRAKDAGASDSEATKAGLDAIQNATRASNAAAEVILSTRQSAPRSSSEALRGEGEAPPMEGSSPSPEMAPRASESVPEASQRPIEDSTQPQELSEADLSPAELAAFQRQTEPTELSANDLSPEERLSFGFEDLIENNASGESAASLEAQNRFRDEQDAGQHRMILNRDGSVTPIVTADGVDYAAKDGQIIVQSNVWGKDWGIIDQGGVPDAIAEGRVNAAKDNLNRAAMERMKPDEEITLSSENTPSIEEPKTTSTKNAVVEAERAAEGRDPIIKEVSKSHEKVVEEAQAELAKNPAAADGIVAKLTNDGPKNISTKEEAILLLEKTRLQNAREDAANRASDPKATEEQKAQAKAEWNSLEARLNEMDHATDASGSEWGSFGAFRQRQMRRDFSLAAMESRERVARGRPLNEAEAAQLKAHADKIAELQDALDKTTSNSEVFSQAEREATKERKIKIRNIERPTLERLRIGAEESKKALESMFRRASAGLDPTALVHLTRIGMYHIARGAYKVADFARAMRDDLKTHYDRIKDQIPEIHKEALAAHAKETIQSVVDKAEGKYTHKDVYEVAKAHIQSGMHGEDAVMAATAKSLGVPERTARILFSEYGKAKFASKDAIKTELREIRQLTQMQESIDRLTEGKPALKSGVQRDPPTAEVREKRRKLNDLLKTLEKKTPPSDEERLRTYQQMRLKNVTNQIEDINRQLANKKKDERTPTPDDTPELKALKKERDDLNSTLSRYTNPPPAVNPKDPYAAKNKVEQARLKKEIFDINRRLEERDFGKKQGVVDKPDAETLKLREQKAALIEKYKSLQNPPPATKPADPHAPVTKRLKEQLAEYERRLKENDFVKPEKVERVKNKENESLAFDLHEAKVAYHKHYLKSQLENAPIEKKLWQVVVNTNGLAKAIHTAFDIGAFGKQAGWMFLGHPYVATKNALYALNAARSPVKTLAADTALKAKPNYRNGNYKKAGLALTQEASALTRAEEEFMTAYLDKLPTNTRSKIVNAGNATANVTLSGVRFSERFHRTFLNKMRTDGFDAMVATLAKDPTKPTKGELTSIADTINNFTGRGKIINGTENIQLPSMVLWATRLYASRVNILTGRSFWAALMHREPKIAAGIAWEYARSLAGLATIYAFASMFKPKDDKTPLMEFDPRSGDFGKLKFNMPYGTVVVDINAGLGPYAALLAQEISGERKTGKGDIVPLHYGDKPKRGAYDPTRWDLVTNFGKNRLVPWLGGAVSAGTGVDPVGKETSLGREAINSTTPITMLQLVENLKDSNDPMASAILTALDAMGFSNSIRTPHKKGN